MLLRQPAPVLPTLELTPLPPKLPTLLATKVSISMSQTIILYLLMLLSREKLIHGGTLQCEISWPYTSLDVRFNVYNDSSPPT